MSPAPTDIASYWSSGGEVLSRAGALSDRRAMALLRFYRRRDLGCRDKSDDDGAEFCARMALQLASATATADAWRRAAGDKQQSASPFGELRSALRHLGMTSL